MQGAMIIRSRAFRGPEEGFGTQRLHVALHLPLYLPFLLLLFLLCYSSSFPFTFWVASVLSRTQVTTGVFYLRLPSGGRLGSLAKNASPSYKNASLRDSLITGPLTAEKFPQAVVTKSDVVTRQAVSSVWPSAFSFSLSPGKPRTGSWCPGEPVVRHSQQGRVTARAVPGFWYIKS